jgi:hypothetical protein
MIAPSIVVTAAHALHVDCDTNKQLHQLFGVIRAPDVGQSLEKAELIAEDAERDIALLKILNSRSTHSLTLANSVFPIGTSVGSLGFPLATIDDTGFHLILRFQSASISSYNSITLPTYRTLYSYETDALMYGGSSGCPGFSKDCVVFGLHNRQVIEGPSQGQQMIAQNRQQRRQQLRQQSKQQAKGEKPSTRHNTDRLAISLWVPSTDIITFANTNGIMIH